MSYHQSCSPEPELTSIVWEPEAKKTKPRMLVVWDYSTCVCVYTRVHARVCIACVCACVCCMRTHTPVCGVCLCMCNMC